MSRKSKVMFGGRGNVATQEQNFDLFFKVVM